jgi:hypothetical protein
MIGNLRPLHRSTSGERLTGNMRKHFSSFPFRVLPSRFRTTNSLHASHLLPHANHQCQLSIPHSSLPHHRLSCPPRSPEISSSPPTTGCNSAALSLQVGNGTTTKPSSAAVCPGVSLSVVICRSYEGGGGGRTGSCLDFNNGDGSIGRCDME